MIPEISVPLLEVNNSTYSTRKEGRFGHQVKQVLCSDSSFLVLPCLPFSLPSLSLPFPLPFPSLSPPFPPFPLFPFSSSSPFFPFPFSSRLLTELESPSWWPFSTKLWKTPLEWKPKETPAAPDPKPREGILLRIPVIITHRTDSNAKPGKLALLPSGLEIRDCNSQLVHRFESRDVDDIRVHTPYEISVRQRFIGKPDNSFRLLSARMPEAIPVLQVHFGRKMQFLEDALGFAGAGKSPQADLGTSVWQAGGW